MYVKFATCFDLKNYCLIFTKSKYKLQLVNFVINTNKSYNTLGYPFFFCIYIFVVIFNDFKFNYFLFFINFLLLTEHNL